MVDSSIDPLRDITGREVASDPLSDSSCSLLRGWLSTCLSSHDRCRRFAGHNVPTRLIDVGPSDSSHEPYLYITGPSDSNLSYATLSYCWGLNAAQMTTLTKNNLHKMTQNIDVENLSKNFQDAITITRKLGLRYLWIDALCIVQKSMEDWALESERMGEYYKGGTVMISALASSNSDDGILKVRDIDARSVSVSVEGTHAFIRPVLDDAFSAITTDRDSDARYPIVIQPLNERAWALQERLFAPRIIHFTNQQMIWECKSCAASEDNQYHFDDWQPRSRSDLVNLVRPETPKEGGTSQKPPSIKRIGWFQLVEAYTARNITYSNDILPGLSGLARSVHELTDFKYIAGLWLGQPSVFIRSLLWNVETDSAAIQKRPPKPSRNGSPSWSWACVEGTIAYDNQESFRFPQNELDPIFSLKEVLLATTNPYGQVYGATLGLVGHVHLFEGAATFAAFHTRKAQERWSSEKRPVSGRRECTYFDSSYPDASTSSQDGNAWDDDVDTSRKTIDIRLDFPIPDYDWPSRKHYLLFMCVWDRDKDFPDDYSEHQEYLVLRKKEDVNPSTVERIGMAEVMSPYYLDISEKEGWVRRRLFIV